MIIRQVVVAIVCAFTFGLSYGFGSCLPRPPPDPTEPYLDDLVSFYCSPNEFNEIGKLEERGNARQTAQTPISHVS